MDFDINYKLNNDNNNKNNRVKMQQEYTTLQKLLIDEIINKSYDQDEFQDFIL